MKDKLYESINTMTYLLWEHTKSENALSLWYCAEDIANIFEKNNVITINALDEIISKRNEDGYREFIRLLSYRIHKYTGELSTVKNWFTTEKLINNSEWKNAVISAAEILRSCRDLSSNPECRNIIKSIRSEQIRNYYLKEKKENI